VAHLFSHCGDQFVLHNVPTVHDYFGFGTVHGAGVYGVVLVDSIVREMAACSSFLHPFAR
jgi:hypothetical protein